MCDIVRDLNTLALLAALMALQVRVHRFKSSENRLRLMVPTREKIFTSRERLVEIDRSMKSSAEYGAESLRMEIILANGNKDFSRKH